MYQAKRQGGGRARVASGSLTRVVGREESPVAHLESLIGVVDSRTGFSRDHAELTARYAALLARQLGLSEETAQALRVAGLLHDVGNIGVPSELLSRPGPLTPDELEVVKQHVILSEMLIEHVPYATDVVQAVIHHHERWDGAGYPRGLRGEQIPLVGRLMMVASAYAALVAPRPYRPARTPDEALAALTQGAGSQFDPALVAVMRRVVSTR
jgi:HD-GYP domain-containing protein (c-di-GMP phosphodiesterase class II)